jgi:hypothetical protein
MQTADEATQEAFRVCHIFEGNVVILVVASDGSTHSEWVDSCSSFSMVYEV